MTLDHPSAGDNALGEMRSGLHAESTLMVSIRTGPLIRPSMHKKPNRDRVQPAHEV